MIAWSGRPAAPAASGGRATLSAWKLTCLFVLLFDFSWVIGAKDEHVCFADAQGYGRGSSSVKCLAQPHMDVLRYDIHAKFAAYRCASARVDSRDSEVDSVLIAGHAGTAAAVRGSARESALRGERRYCAWPGGKRGSKLAAGADAELGEDFPQVVGDGGGADEQLRGDLRVGGAVAGQPGDQRFLRGQGIWRLDGLRPGVPAGRPQLDAGPFGKRRGADRVEDLVRAAELIAGVTPAPLAAQPLAVDQVGAGLVPPAGGYDRSGRSPRGRGSRRPRRR